MSCGFLISSTILLQFIYIQLMILVTNSNNDYVKFYASSSKERYENVWIIYRIFHNLQRKKTLWLFYLDFHFRMYAKWWLIGFMWDDKTRLQM